MKAPPGQARLLLSQDDHAVGASTWSSAQTITPVFVRIVACSEVEDTLVDPSRLVQLCPSTLTKAAAAMEPGVSIPLSTASVEQGCVVDVIVLCIKC